MIPNFIMPDSVWKSPSLYSLPFKRRESSAVVRSAGTLENSDSIVGWPITTATPAILVGSALRELGFFHHWEIMKRIATAWMMRVVMITLMTQGLEDSFGGQGTVVQYEVSRKVAPAVNPLPTFAIRSAAFRGKAIAGEPARVENGAPPGLVS